MLGFVHFVLDLVLKKLSKPVDPRFNSFELKRAGFHFAKTLKSLINNTLTNCLGSKSSFYNLGIRKFRTAGVVQQSGTLPMNQRS